MYYWGADVRLEAVMNSIKNALEMLKTGSDKKPGPPLNPHFNGNLTQVHNTL
jgi:hypothetical protein